MSQGIIFFGENKDKALTILLFSRLDIPLHSLERICDSFQSTHQGIWKEFQRNDGPIDCILPFSWIKKPNLLNKSIARVM